MTAKDLIETYCKAWNASDPDKRQEILSTCWAEHGLYSDPRCQLEGRQALSDQIGRFHADDPGASLHLDSGVDAHTGRVRFQWAVHDAADQRIAVGTSFAKIDDDGLLAEVTGFFGPFPRL